jgi:hypothetical protein
MKVRSGLSLLALMLLAISSRPLPAQAPHDARVTVAHPGIQSLKTDLDRVLALTEPVEHEQIENVAGLIDTFFAGVDQERPIQCAVPMGTKPVSVMVVATLPDVDEPLAEFRDNMSAQGYEFERDAQNKSLYWTDADPDFGWMRNLTETRQVMVLMTSIDIEAEAAKENLPVSEYKKQLRARMRAVIADAIVPDLQPQGNVSAEILNNDETPASQSARRESFAKVRTESLERVQKRPDESATEFEFRRGFAENLADEVERFIAEVSKATAVLTLESDDKSARSVTLSTSAAGIPGTQLADAIHQIGTQPDPFVTIPKVADSALSLRLNHPIDPMRQTNILELLKLAELDIRSRINESTKLSDAEKQASNDATSGIIAVIADGIGSGWMNAFIEASPDGQGDFVSVSAFSAPTASKLTEVLPLLAKAGKSNVVEMNADKQGEVAIHRIQIGAGFSKFMDTAFGGGKDIFVGIGPQHVWLASGPGSKDRLKQTIADLGAPADNPSPLKIELKLLPWVQKLDRIAKKKPEAETASDKELQREQARRRARAIAACTSDDEIVLEFRMVDGQLAGDLKLNTGVLRWIGKEIAAYSKTNLDD